MNQPQSQPRSGSSTNTDEIHTVYRRILESSTVEARSIVVDSGRKMHVIESGDGPPLVLLHPSGGSSLVLLPLLEQLNDVRGIAIDRPGYGMSDVLDVPRDSFRDYTVACMDRILDALGLAETALAGSSGGGTWALWYAMARPERVRQLVLLGAAPGMPGTRVPPPQRIMTLPVVGNVLPRVMKPTPQAVVRLMTFMGEGDTIVNYPNVIDSIVAVANDPVSARTDRAEMQSLVSPLGFRRESRVQSQELRSLSVPTLLIWGDREPLGAVDVAESIANVIPCSQLEILPAGHGPWLGHPERTAELISKFIQ